MQAAIAGLVTMRGGKLYHVRDSSKSPELEHLPDLIILDPRAARVIFAELKSQSRTVTLGQAAVMQMLAECNRFESAIVRPSPKPGELSYDAFMRWLGEG